MNSIIGDVLKKSYSNNAIWSNELTVLVNGYLFAETEEELHKYVEAKQLEIHNGWKSKPIRSFRNRGGDFQIFVRTQRGKTICLWIDGCDTIGRIKEKLWLIEGYEIPSQQLIKQGKVLQDQKFVGDYNFQKETWLHSIVKYRGWQ